MRFFVKEHLSVFDVLIIDRLRFGANVLSDLLQGAKEHSSIA
jgi:hypothetical protein